ncbi:UDP-N-acetylmuramoyl-L-alanine--D-glutamate ligase [Thermoanaerobacterium thermosaccharolyticum]|uniref:UDP-N-acetylmuramoyl-L-alanine--D-glutamate ligase n=1 Tax=Thermoanaerobacterium thermosaccharolyticum TaxID=1517 RepID=UPI0020A47C63|nr:UDP-N-acetylmuramoyl-L-alanine--D-glutamate ligase [Thermoanaerobacterium thermosaccharolyticum]MCP2239893.1 UDP-N-acetylmuramoylalanine--D-glutamate ligase [Thermoanaerobacterium thermosaccharolyticum]
MDLKGKKVIVAGFGLSGKSLCKVLTMFGAIIFVYDSKSKEELKDDISEFKDSDITFCFKDVTDEFLEGAQMVIVSPGIPIDSEIVTKAKVKGIEVIGEVEFAYRLSKAPIYAITGTNGKTTTTSLLGEIFKNSGVRTYVAGNIGYPLVEAAVKAGNDDVIVAEISSFQLETIKEFRPVISAIINITPDHLNRHKTLENYINIKGRIFENQSFNEYTVLNYDDKNMSSLFKKAKCKVFPFSRAKVLDQGTYIEDGKIVISSNGEKNTIIDINDIYIPGNHNVENAMVASTMAFLAGIDVNIINTTLKTFKGVEHRIEFVRSINGVKYYNDSKGTNPDAAIKAIEAMKGPIILIAGGYDKGVSFDEFTSSFNGRVRKLILLGETRDLIYKSAVKNGFSREDITVVNSLDDAVYAAYKMSMPGDNVLLSPACASWDMFKNFEERGKLFKDTVNSLRG